MLKSYFKIALRHLRRHPGYSFINVFGLAVGLACCTLIALFVRGELSYDRFHEKGDRIYRVALQRFYPNRHTFYAPTPMPLGETIVQDYPEAVQFTKLTRLNQAVQVQQDDRPFEEQRVYFADSNFFDVFTVPLRQGDPKTALAEPNTMVITTETAARYFGAEDPMGQTLDFDFGTYTITGVAEPMPANSHFHFDFLLTLTDGFFDPNNWISFAVPQYIVLEAGADPAALEAKFPDMVRRYAGAQLEAQLGISFGEYQAAGNGYRYFLQPLESIHLHSQLEGELEPNGDITRVYLFGAVAFFILLIACINFMNLATARSAGRAKEVGVRKVLGSSRNRLVRQFLTESVLMSLVAMLLALGLIALLLPAFNDLSGKSFAMGQVSGGWLLPGLVGFALLVGLLAGGYPAFFLSAFRPASVLKGKGAQASRSAFRNGLVVFQFALSIALLVGTTVVYDQMRYMMDKNLGFEKEQVVVIQRAGALGEQQRAFKEELLNDTRIRSVARTTTLPGGYFPGAIFQPVGEATENLTTRAIFADADYLEALGIEVAQGRFFSEEFASDSLAVVFNEAAVREAGWADPLGQQVTRPTDPETGGARYTVVGVVRDFHFQSLHEQISPIAFLLGPPQFVAPQLAVRVAGADAPSVLNAIEAKWQQFAPDEPFKYSFLDQDFDALYQAEQQTSKLFSVFTALAMFIACLGLFGLAAFTVEQRTKEIGIRKVMGASVPGLVALLSKDFLKLVGLAFVLAAPVAYFLMNGWLENFAYRIDLSLWTFLLAGMAALVIALLTVSYQATRAAHTDPVKALRYE